MSSSDHAKLRLAAFSGLIAGLALLAGCTAQPLYGTANRMALAPADQDNRRIASVEVAPIGNREGLEVRNHLIFLLNGGAGQPSEPAYKMKLKVETRSQAVAVVQNCPLAVCRDSIPTAGAIRLTADYEIADAKTGDAVSKGSRNVVSSYDSGRQEFANYRAKMDANDRAARELAELLRLAIVHDLQGRQTN